MDEKLEQLKQKYMEVPIPSELDAVVARALKQRKKTYPRYRWLAAIGAAVILFVAGLNTSTTFANAVAEVPLVGKLVKVLTIGVLEVDDQSFQAKLEAPAITNMDNKTLESTLNNKYLEENRQLYGEFMKEMQELKQADGGHLGVESGYVVKTDNEQLLSIGRYVVNTVGSSSTTFKYDTIDKRNEILITLPSLFRDDRYIEVISGNIREQMKTQMNEDPAKFYWVAGVENEVNSYFETIKKDQSFYINKEGKLVIAFDKYEVAPGYMGVVEFVIPTDLLRKLLASGEYIK